MLVVPILHPVDGVLQLINATSECGDIVPFSRAAEIAVLDMLDLESGTAARVDGQE